MEATVKLKDERGELPRTVRGKRPDFYPTAGVDDAMSMILVLAQEIESLELDADALREREAWRQGLLDRLFHVANQRRAELEQRHTEESYARTLADIAAR